MRIECWSLCRPGGVLSFLCVRGLAGVGRVRGSSVDDHGGVGSDELRRRGTNRAKITTR